MSGMTEFSALLAARNHAENLMSLGNGVAVLPDFRYSCG